MKSRTWLSSASIFLIPLAAWGQTTVRGAEPWTDEQIAGMVAESTTAETVGFVHLDLTAAPMSSLFGPLQASENWTDDLAEGNDAALAQVDAMAKGLQVREAFVVFDLPEDGTPRFYGRLRADVPAKSIADLLGRGPMKTGVEGEHAWFAGGGERAAVDAGTPEAVAAALKSVGDSPIVVAYVPSVAARKQVAGFAPPTPESAKRLVAEGVGRDLKWAAIGYDPRQRGKLALRGEAVDEQAAARVRTDAKAALAETMQAARESGMLERAGIELDEARAAYALATVKGEGTAIELTIDANEPQVAALVDRGVAGWKRLNAVPADMQTSNALKQIVLAMHNFHDTYKHLPASAAQKPPENTWKTDQAVSWRVMILPFLEHGALWDEYKIDEPWDSENNKKLIARMPEVYRSTDPTVPADKTTYQMPLMEGAFGNLERSSSLLEYRDGTSNTIMVVESAPEQAVIWTKPDDLEIDPAKLAELVGEENADAFLAAMADGAVLAYPKNLEPDTVRKLIQCADGEVIDARKLQAKP